MGPKRDWVRGADRPRFEQITLSEDVEHLPIEVSGGPEEKTGPEAMLLVSAPDDDQEVAGRWIIRRMLSMIEVR